MSSHDGMVVMIGTAVIIAILVAIGYLYMHQRTLDAALPASSTPGGAAAGASNANAWTRLFGSTLSGVGTGLAGGGF